MSAQSSAVFLERVTVKLLPIINSQLPWYPESGDYVLTEEFLYRWCSDIRQCFCFHPLGEVINRYCCEFAVSLSYWQWANQIHCPPLQRP
jgi:hypothetical protein